MKSFGRLSLAALVWCLWASGAFADVQEYCGAYARDVANGRVSGGEILSGKVAGTTPETSAKWNAANAQALAGCLAQYVNGAGGPTDVTAAAAPHRVLSKPGAAAKTIAKSRRRSSAKAGNKSKSRAKTVPKAASKLNCTLLDNKTWWSPSRNRLKICRTAN